MRTQGVLPALPEGVPEVVSVECAKPRSDACVHGMLLTRPSLVVFGDQLMTIEEFYEAAGTHPRGANAMAQSKTRVRCAAGEFTFFVCTFFVLCVALAATHVRHNIDTAQGGAGRDSPAAERLVGVQKAD